jgi:hypothetical protein
LRRSPTLLQDSASRHLHDKVPRVVRVVRVSGFSGFSRFAVREVLRFDPGDEKGDGYHGGTQHRVQRAFDDTNCDADRDGSTCGAAQRAAARLRRAASVR